MKKLFMFLAVAGLATFGASCSSDDGGNEGGGTTEKQLIAKASPSTVEVNKDVTFSATYENKAVDGVKFYLDGKELTNPHKFATKGDYKVVARKDGFKESAAITVKVTEAGEPGEEQILALTVLPSEVTLGSAVSFIVKEGATDVSSSAEIFVNNQKITGTSYTATAVGTYKVVAKKAGAKDSAEKTFTVVEGGEEPTSNFIEIGGEYYDIDETRMTANASQNSDKQWIIYVYTEEESGDKYSIFYFDSYKLNAAETEYVARTRTGVAVFQDPANPGVLTPGMAGSEMMFITSFATDFVTDITFTLDDFTAFTIDQPGATGKVTIAAAVAGGSIDFSGDYTGVGVVPVDATGTPVAAKGKANIHTNFKVSDIK